MAKLSDQKMELVVVGTGGAGLAAAVAAAESGLKKITMLESRAVQGGNAVFVQGMFGACSRRQNELASNVDRDELFKKAMAYAHWKANPRLVRALIEKSGDTVDWLEDHGLVIDQLCPAFPGQKPVVFHLHKAPQKLGAEYVRLFIQECKTHDVQVQYRARARKILCNREGAVCGVQAQTPQDDIQINTDSVILATGGFLGNADMIRTYLPTYRPEEVHLAGFAHNGDGLALAKGVGGAEDGMLVLEMNGPTFAPSTALSIVVHQPYTLWVNQRGQRFTDESLVFFPETANSIFRQPGKVSFTLFDQKIKQRLLDGEIGPLDAHLVDGRQWPKKLENELQKHMAQGRVKSALTWEEIADFIGVDPTVLKREIETYNAGCDQGGDRVFLKDCRYLHPMRTPPFYAVKAGIKIMTTHGGIKINHNMEVVDNDERPIAGLFAAGVETGCTDVSTYDIQLTGHSFGFSVASGRIAGEQAAAYLENRDDFS